MRQKKIIIDFLKNFFKFRPKKVKNYLNRTNNFNKHTNQLVEQKFILKKIKKYNKKIILDYGCNDCYFANKLSKEGSNKKVTAIETTSPKVIIQPKSIIGLIPLNIKDRNAHIVVKTVYKIGINILPVVSITAFSFVRLGNSFLNCKNLTVT